MSKKNLEKRQQKRWKKWQKHWKEKKLRKMPSFDYWDGFISVSAGLCVYLYVAMCMDCGNKYPRGTIDLL